MLVYNPETRCVELKADRDIAVGQSVSAWCGPQPNSRLMLNYGIVDEDNPYDKLQVTVTLPNTDPLFRLKRTVLAAQQLTTAHTFDMQRKQPLPPQLLPFLRIVLADSEQAVNSIKFGAEAEPLSPETESQAVSQIIAYLDARLARYPRSIEEDTAIIESTEMIPRQKVAARLTRIEKTILSAARQQLQAHADGLGITVDRSPAQQTIKLT